MKNTIQVQVWSHGVLEIRFSDKTVDEWIESDKEKGLISANHAFIDDGIYTSDDIVDNSVGNTVWKGYTLYYMKTEKFLANNSVLSYLGEYA